MMGLTITRRYIGQQQLSLVEWPCLHREELGQIIDVGNGNDRH